MKGEELADLMGANEEDSRILINDLKLIGIKAVFMQKAIVRAFRSKASLVETLRTKNRGAENACFEANPTG